MRGLCAQRRPGRLTRPPIGSAAAGRVLEHDDHDERDERPDRAERRDHAADDRPRRREQARGDRSGDGRGRAHQPRASRAHRRGDPAGRRLGAHLSPRRGAPSESRARCDAAARSTRQAASSDRGARSSLEPRRCRSPRAPCDAGRRGRGRRLAAAVAGYTRRRWRSCSTSRCAATTTSARRSTTTGGSGRASSRSATVRAGTRRSRNCAPSLPRCQRPGCSMWRAGPAFSAFTWRARSSGSTRARRWWTSPAGGCRSGAWCAAKRCRCRFPTASSSASSPATSTATCRAMSGRISSPRPGASRASSWLSMRPCATTSSPRSGRNASWAMGRATAQVAYKRYFRAG